MLQHHESCYGPRITHTLLDDGHLVLATSKDPSLRVYRYASGTRDGNTEDHALGLKTYLNPEPSDDDRDCSGYLFSLALPLPRARWGPRALQLFDIRSINPATSISSPFSQNPTSTIVAVTFVVDSSPSHEDESTFILLIPYSTFGTRISKALLPPPSPVQGGQEYAWAEWGLSGSLLLTLCHPPSSNPPLAVHKAFCFPYGSRYPFLLCNSLDATSGDVVIFDLDPCVGRRAQSEADRDVDAVVKAISATPNPSWSTESLQTATPFATYRKVHVEFPENAIPRQVVMNHDGFSILVRV